MKSRCAAEQGAQRAHRPAGRLRTEGFLEEVTMNVASKDKQFTRQAS